MKPGHFHGLWKACGVQSLLLVVTCTLSGCPFPLSLEEERAADGGTAPAAPSILRTDPVGSDVITLQRLQQSDTRTFTATIEDANGGTIDARLFFDPEPRKPALGTVFNLTTLPVAFGAAPRYKLEATLNPCLNEPQMGAHVLELYVIDQRITDPFGREAGSDHGVSSFWMLNCQ